MPPKKILLAEDDADDRIFFSDFLKTRSDIHLIPAVENGEEVFNYLDKIHEATELPDLIILDQNMPKISGLQALQLLKTTMTYKNIMVVIYSTYADDNLRRQGIDGGAKLVFSKPYTPEGYHEMIDEMLDLFR